MKRSLAGLFILSALLIPSLVWAEAPPVTLMHTVTGYSSGDKTVTIDISVHVTNPGNSALSNVTLTFVPMPPFISGRSTLDVGSLAPRQGADFTLHLEAMAIAIDKLAHRPLFFAGKCDEADGTQVEFPVSSYPGLVNDNLYLQSHQNEPSPSGVVAPLLYQSSASSALATPGDFLFKWGNQYPVNPTGVAVDGTGNVFVVDSDRIQVFDSGGNFVGAWGSYGTGIGQFEYPQGVAVDNDGNVYVVDTSNYRIQVFDGSGNFVRTWGSEGSRSGQFESPSGVAVDSGGNIYVVDGGNSRIQVFDSDGNFLRTLGSYGTGKGQFIYPYGVAVDSGGNVYVSDSGNGRIQVFDSSGNFVRTWGSFGTGSGQFYYPEGVAVDSGGNVYVADFYNYRIQVFDSSGNFLRTWGSYGTGNGQFYYPGGVAVGSGGNVYVADTGNSRIQVFTGTGTYISKIGDRSADGSFYYPFGMAVDSVGNVYVADSGNNRIQVFDSGGNFLRAWGSYGSDNGQFRYPSGVAVGSSDNVYVTDTNNNRIQVFDGSGNFLRTWGSYGAGDGQFQDPVGVAVDSVGNVYVADGGFAEGHISRIEVFDSGGNFLRTWGSYGTGDGQFQYPFGVSVDSVGNVYVADTSNNRIQVFDNSGNFLRAWGSYGSGNGQFNYPQGLAVDSGGNVYVTDTNNNRIQVFDNGGNFLRTWGGAGTGDGQFCGPEGVATNAPGTIVYVVDSGNQRIQAFVGYGDAIPPTSSITAPFNGAVITTMNYTIAGTAADNPDGSGVAKVEVSTDGGKTWNPATGTISWSYSWTIPANGAYTLQAVATDKNGNVGTPISISVTVDNTVTYPNSAITAPTNGAFLTGRTYTITGTTTDRSGSGIKNVKVGITPNGGTTRWHRAAGTTSWRYRWPLPKDDNYTIMSKATDEAGGVESPTASVGVTVDKTKPTVTITPLANKNLSGTTATITGTASDAGSGVNNVQVGITPRGSTKTTWYPATGTTSWNCTWTLPTDGKYIIKAMATDNAGNKKTTAAVNVTVDNTPPTVNIASPANNKILKRAIVTISGKASDAGSGVANAQVGITPSGGTTTWYMATGKAFWLYKWIPRSGTYTIQAMATDEAGNIGYSSEPHTVIIAKNPEKIYLLSPPNGASVSVPFELSWSYEGSVRYYLVYFSSSTHTRSVFSSGSDVTIDTMAPGTYYWWVVAVKPWPLFPVSSNTREIIVH
jgi:DNA-binding beta-propeller fold protein YncE